MINDSQYEKLKVTGQTYSEDLDSIVLEKCTFNNCIFESVTISNSELKSCTFNNCSFIGFKFDNVILGKLAFKGCRLMAIDWYSAASGMERQNGSILKLKATFDSCKLNNSNFSLLDLRESAFKNCTLSDSAFSDSNLKGLTIDNCDFSNATFNKTNLEDTKLSSSYGFVIDPTSNRVKGMSINIESALGLVSGLGINVE